MDLNQNLGLPKLGYLTMLDIYILGSFCLLSLAAFVITLLDEETLQATHATAVPLPSFFQGYVSLWLFQSLENHREPTFDHLISAVFKLIAQHVHIVLGKYVERRFYISG